MQFWRRPRLDSVETLPIKALRHMQRHMLWKTAGRRFQFTSIMWCDLSRQGIQASASCTRSSWGTGGRWTLRGGQRCGRRHWTPCWPACLGRCTTTACCWSASIQTYRHPSRRNPRWDGSCQHSVPKCAAVDAHAVLMSLGTPRTLYDDNLLLVRPRRSQQGKAFSEETIGQSTAGRRAGGHASYAV